MDQDPGAGQSRHSFPNLPISARWPWIAGYLTVPQLTASLGLARSWIYDRIHNGTIQIALDPGRNLYLFPDTPETFDRLRRLRAGELNSLRF